MEEQRTPLSPDAIAYLRSLVEVDGGEHTTDQVYAEVTAALGLEA